MTGCTTCGGFGDRHDPIAHRGKGCAECTPDGNGPCLEGCRAKSRHVHDEWCEIDWDEVFGR